jgi:hypothetical protein
MQFCHSQDFGTRCFECGSKGARDNPAALNDQESDLLGIASLHTGATVDGKEHYRRTQKMPSLLGRQGCTKRLAWVRNSGKPRELDQRKEFFSCNARSVFQG